MDERGRLFAVGLGQDYPKALVSGLAARFPESDPTAWARCTIYVNSGRMLRRIRDEFDAGPPRLLPKLRLLSELSDAGDFPEIPQALKPLELKLDLAELLMSLIETNPELAPRSAVFDLAESLAALLDEMHGEGVGPEALAALDVGGFARHWEQGRAIVEAAFTYFGDSSDRLAGSEARRRLIVKALSERWKHSPPKGTILIAGSTGSRGATRMLMEAVARLPNGHVVLPGFDFDQPPAVWTALERGIPAEDHPQYRFRVLMDALELAPDEVIPWDKTPPMVPERNRLLSLALRPAPVTDQWRNEGRRLTELTEATAGMTLVEAPHQRAEAGAIALRLRKAVEDGQKAALISPDRMLTRRVTAALQRWEIEPDDSAGEPLHQAAPGRFLRHVAQLLETAPELPQLLVLLKHPITASSKEIRGPHLRWTRELELYLRGKGTSHPDAEKLRGFAEDQKVKDGRENWAEWLAGLLASVPRGKAGSLSDHVAHHLDLAERLATGFGGEDTGKLWTKDAGETAASAMQALRDAGDRGGAMTARDYTTLLHGHLSGFNVLDPVRPHPNVMIWGTLEARVGGADLVILAGLTDGTWPDLPAPDTWLNRPMRREAGLLSPERRIGLSAHDFQQAIAAREVMLTRPERDEEAETVPSRWLNRLTNLLGGLGPEGAEALSGMQARGQSWLRGASALEQPDVALPRAPRPSPCPPVAVRPRQLAVTRITQLIRDPYAVYARHILRLRKLNPLAPEPDARMRGIALHEIMEKFVVARETWHGDRDAARQCLSGIAREELARATPVLSMQALWHARLMAVADRIIDGEFARLEEGEPALTEDWGRLDLSDLDFTLIARPDRIDRLQGGGYAVYDYKSGQPPSKDMVLHFEKQLPLEAAMLEQDGFTALPKAPVEKLGYIAIGASGQDRPLDIDTQEGRLADVTLDGLRELITRYRDREQGYSSIRAAQLTNFAGDYDHLARYGEWDLTSEVERIMVGPEETS
ncbi:double-strand break repair protein AddB [Aliiruegeria sabulilitoris]|uniref:double-strand break repair protein AddB n=1 Tax=Aliiruegeria sabulilitoris TaxID=1510458 RepID=UPI000837919E|nr:double-strand break repair protein AddB [Aliiruegeria sabulilitoris]NDR57551.1 double-strand break repair protein AddB [Pseudoruegeria sp. M32A2M]